MSGAPYSPVMVGLVGSGIQASLSPRLHQDEGAALGIPYTYRLFDIRPADATEATVASRLDTCQQSGFQGLNVTHPFKQVALELVDELSPDAEAIGAVNTIVFKDGRRIGHNTDWWGFGESLQRGLPQTKRDKVVLLGAGGAGAAVAYALMRLGVGELHIYDVDTGKAQHLADRLAGRVAVVADLENAVRSANGVVNTTPMGMDHHPGSPLPARLLTRALWVADIVYFPLETQLLRDARAAGCALLNGGGMVVFQATRAFELFTGVTPDAERMLRNFATLTETAPAA